MMASEALNRILHHCTTVTIRGDSYRLKDRKKIALQTLRELRKDGKVIKTTGKFYFPNIVQFSSGFYIPSLCESFPLGRE